MNPDRPGLDPAYLLACLIAVVVIGGFALLAGIVADQDAHRPPVTISCQEDDPCWNPATMGNHRGWVCALETNGEIDRYTDTQGLNPDLIVPCP